MATPKLSVHAGGIDAGSVQDPDRIEHRRIGQRAIGIGGLKEVLIALDHAAERKAFDGLRQEELRLDFRVHRLGENFVEGQAEKEELR